MCSSSEADSNFRLRTTADVRSFLRMGLAPAALGTALELGLFQRLAAETADAEQLAGELNIPLRRCQCWLELLAGMGLLQRTAGTYTPSPVACTAILDAYSHESWAFLAEEARGRYPAALDLTDHITHPVSVWEGQGRNPPDYMDQMIGDPVQARRFTTMLYELHIPLAERLAEALDMTGVQRMLDLGGGSGVISMALLRRHPELTSVVVDIQNVCEVGREFAARTPMADRIDYHVADFLHDELPGDFDLILECDIGVYGEELFRRLRAALKPGGRFVIVDWLNRPEEQATLQQLVNDFASALQGAAATCTVADLTNMLARCGYEQITGRPLGPAGPHEATGRPGPTIIEARA